MNLKSQELLPSLANLVTMNQFQLLRFCSLIHRMGLTCSSASSLGEELCEELMINVRWVILCLVKHYTDEFGC